MTLKIGKQTELPRRPGDYRSARGDMNLVRDEAHEEAEEMARRHGKVEPPKEQAPEAAGTPAPAKPAKEEG